MISIFKKFLIKLFKLIKKEINDTLNHVRINFNIKIDMNINIYIDYQMFQVMATTYFKY